MVQPDPLGVVAAQHVAVPVRGLGGRRQRLQGARRGEGLEHAVRDGVGQAEAGHPLGDGGAQHPVGQARGAGGEHVEQPRTAGVLEAARPQCPGDDLLGADRSPVVVRVRARAEAAQDGRGHVAAQHGVFRAPELGPRGRVRTDPDAQPVAAGQQGARGGLGVPVGVGGGAGLCRTGLGRTDWDRHERRRIDEPRLGLTRHDATSPGPSLTPSGR